MCVCIVYLRNVSDIGTIIEIACMDHMTVHQKRRRNNNMPDLDES